MTPPARPGMPVPRGGPGASRPPQPRPPRPPVPRAPVRPSPPPRGDVPADGTGAVPADTRRPDAGAGDAAATDAQARVGDRPTPSATSDAVTTYTARRGALGVRARPVVADGSAARFAERVAMRRRVARHKALGAGAAAVLLGGLAWLLLLSPVLALHAVEVQVTGAGTVVDVTDVQAVVAEVDGTPLPRLDTVGLRDRVLEVPGVREAKVTRTWPHGLVIALVSREPVAAVPQAADPGAGLPGTDPREAPRGGYTLLDTEGFGVGWAPEPPDGLPVVQVPVGEEHERTLTAVLTILDALPPELQAEVASIEAATRDTVRMSLRDGRSVVWGSAADAALKIRVLQALRAAPAAADAQEYDVSAPTLPITR